MGFPLIARMSRFSGLGLLHNAQPSAGDGSEPEIDVTFALAPFMEQYHDEHLSFQI